MSKSIEDMYQELLDKGSMFDGGDKSLMSFASSRFDDDDDSEDFLTSKEIVKSKQKHEEEYGPIRKGDGVIEEDVHFNLFTKRRKHKYTESEIKAIKESCANTIVHDYGTNDIYHISDEDRMNNDVLAEISMKLGGLKHAYYYVDQYIDAMRIVVQAWEILQKNNYIHSEDEFFKLVASGNIVSKRIMMPRLKRADKYNMDLIIKYISNPELDPSDLVPEEVPIEDDDFYDAKYERRDDETIEEYDKRIDEMELEEIQRLLSDDEVQYIVDHTDNPEEMRVKEIKPKMIKNYDRKGLCRSKKKKLSKKKRYAAEGLHKLLNKVQHNMTSSSNDYTRSYMITHSMFEQEKPDKDIWDDFYFDGSWANDDDVFLYDFALREELLKQHPARERYLTYADKELAQFFTILENNNISTIDLRRKMNYSDYGNNSKESKMTKKENKKIESELIQRITKLNNNPKFKKLVKKAEDKLNKYYDK